MYPPPRKQYEFAVKDSHTVRFFLPCYTTQARLSRSPTATASSMEAEVDDNHGPEGFDPSLPTFIAGDPDAAAAAAANEGIEIPPLPPSQLYDSFQTLYNTVQSWAKTSGAAFIKKNPGNYRDLDGSGTRVPTYYVLQCDRGPGRPSRGTGLRQTSTTKNDCAYKITASATKKNN